MCTAMNVVQTAIPGVLVIEPTVFTDSRGFFLELYRVDRYATCGGDHSFVQDNLSRSAKGVLRGLHFQNPRPQGKLVTVVRGSVFDIAVDVRVGSPSFGAHVSVELNDENRRQVWIPRGFAHGFVVRSDTADIFYKCDEIYSPAHEIALRWDEPKLAINWGCDEPTVSERDSKGRTLAQLAQEGLLPKYSAG
jgi:dTDP-4-dehydrorhamnose 3,5-epimerase